MATQSQGVSLPTATNLWETALASLDPDLQTAIDHKTTGNTNIATAVLRTAKEKRDICLRKRWRYRKSDGKDIVLRDVLDKIVGFIDKFVAVGDVAIQYDPAHAALPWAGVRFVLRAAVSDQRAFGNTVESLETITRLVTQYAVFEGLYLGRMTRIRSEIEEALVEMYAEILKYLARAKSYFQKSTAVRILKSTFDPSEPWNLDVLGKMEERLGRLAHISDAENQQKTADDVEALKAMLSTFANPIKRVSIMADAALKSAEEADFLECLRWLSTVPVFQHHEIHSLNRVQGTGQWLFDHPKHRDWNYSSSSSMLTLHGVPGCGKSSLASMVIDSLISTGQTTFTPLAYFYCARNSFEAERSSPVDVMRSLVRQLATSKYRPGKINDAVFSAYEQRKVEAKVSGFDVQKLKLEEYISLIIEMTESNPAVIVIDAIDEVSKDGQSILLGALKAIIRKSPSVTKVLVTTRTDSQILALVDKELTIRVDRNNVKDDIEKLTKHLLTLAIDEKKLLRGNVPDSLRTDLENSLIQNAGEMFLAVVIQVKNISSQKTDVGLKNAIRQLPSPSLDHLYAERFEHILKMDPGALHIAFQTFSLLLCSQEPLSPRAVLSAVTSEGLKLDIEALIDICSDLILVDTGLNVLRFVHLSVQEFLETKPEFKTSMNHDRVAHLCLKVCSESSSDNALLEPNTSFYHYGLLYWMRHCEVLYRSSDDNSNSQELEDFLFEGSDTGVHFLIWLEEIQRYTESLPRSHAMLRDLTAVCSENCSPIFTICLIGRPELLRRVSSTDDFDCNEKNSLGATPLYLASAKGDAKIVTYLLELGADSDIKGGWFDYPLHAACVNGHGDVAKWLLAQGADPSCSGKFSNAFEACAFGGQESTALILLDDWPIMSQDQYDIIMEQAAYAGFLECIDKIQKKYGSQFGHLGSQKNRLIEQAISRGHIGLLDRILAKSKLEDFPENGVYNAALAGKDDMVCHLLDKGLEIEQSGTLGTPLRAASFMGHISTVRVLIERGVDINATGKVGNALEASAIRGHPAVTDLLLQHGIDVNIRGGLFGNALQAAAYKGHIEVVTMLLAAGVDVFSAGKFTDAFHAAAEGGHENLIEVLLDRGYRFQIEPPKRSYKRRYPETKHYERNFRDASPSSEGHRKKTEVLSKSFEVKPKRAGLPSAQNIADEVKSEDQMHKRKSVQEGQHTYRSGNYAFQLFAAQGDEVSIRRLLERRIEMRIPEFDVTLAFRAAAGKGHLKVVIAFIELAAEAIESVKWAVQDAAEHGRLEVVKFLLSYNSRQYEETCDTAEETRNSSSSQRDQGAPISVTTDQNIHESSVCQDYVFDEVILEACNVTINKDRPEVLDYIFSVLHAENVDAYVGGAWSAYPLTQAAGSESSQVLKLLLNHYSHLFKASGIVKAASTASLKGHLEPLDLIVQKFSSLFNPTLIIAMLLPAVEEDHVDVSKYLLGLLSQETQRSVVPELYILAAGNGCINILNLLRNDMLALESKASTLLQACNVAAQNGHAGIVKKLIEDGAEIRKSVTQLPNFRQLAKPSTSDHPSRPCTALQAAFWGWKKQYYTIGWKKAERTLRKDTIAEIVHAGANVNELTLDGDTPLHFAIKVLSADGINAMIQHGAEVNGISLTISLKGESNLMAAASRPREARQVISLLLDARVVIPSHQTDGPHPLLARILTEFFGKEESMWLTIKSLQDILTDGPGGSVKLILENLPQESAKDERYGLLLHMAAACGDVDFVRLLIQRGVNLDATGYYYGSALQAAARIGHLEIAEMLLSAGANVCLVGGRHEMAIRAAVTGEHFSMLKLVVEHGADINLNAGKTSSSILELAIQRGNQDIFQYLLQNGVDIRNPSGGRESCLMSACVARQVEMAAKLIAKGADVNTPTGTEATSTNFETAVTPLMLACSTGSTELVHLLIDNGAEINQKMEKHGTALQIAAIYGHWPIVQVLIQSGASFCPEAFVEAARSGRTTVVRGLLDTGVVDVDLLPTALKAACSGQQLETIKLLLEELVSTEFEERALQDAAMATCKVRNDQVLRILLGYDQMVSANILTAAVAAGLVGSVEVLIKGGVNLNKADDHGNLPIHVAAYYQRLSIVELLLDEGADPNLKGSQYGDAIRSVLEGCFASRILRVHKSHPMKEIASQLPQHQTYTVLDWIKEIETSRKPMKASDSEDVDFDGMTTSSFGTFSVATEDIDRCSRLIQTLIDHSARPESLDGLFGNHMHLATYLGISNWVKNFIRTGMDVNEKSGYFETPLLAALLGNQILIAESLISSGADVNYTSEQHGTALYIACRKSGNFAGEDMKDVVSLLLHHGALFNADRPDHNPLTAVLEESGRIFSSSPTSPDLIIEMLLPHFPNLPIAHENLVKAVERDTRCLDKKLYTELFFEHSQLLQTSEAAMLAGLSYFSVYKQEPFVEKLVNLLLSRFQDGTINEEMLNRAPTLGTLSLLLQHPNVCPISKALALKVLAEKEGLQRLAMLLNHDAEFCLDDELVTAAAKAVGTDPSPVELMAFRTIWQRYESQDDGGARQSLEQLGIPRHVIEASNEVS